MNEYDVDNECFKIVDLDLAEGGQEPPNMAPLN